jgi:hypothetical protein
MFFVALTVLAIVAGTAGYLGTRRALGTDNLQASGTRTTPPARSEQPNPAGTGGGTVETAEPTTPVAVTPTPDAGKTCPEITDKAVRDANLPADLQLVLYVQLRRTGATPAEAWICKSKDGTLYYQGHLRSRPLLVVTSDHSILLGTGIKGEVQTEGEGFVAINTESDGKVTKYHVSKDSFTLENVGGTSVNYEVVRSVVP